LHIARHKLEKYSLLVWSAQCSAQFWGVSSVKLATLQQNGVVVYVGIL